LCGVALALSASSCALDVLEDWWGDEGEDVGGAGENLVGVEPGETDDAELVQFLPVGRSRAGAPRRIVMRLGPGDLPDLARGDRLITPAEVQVTTRCDVGQRASGCNYNPHVAAQLILTGGRDDHSPGGDRSVAFSDVETITCTRAEHHCRVVFRPSEANHVLRGRYDLPCVRDSSCFVNLVMWAWHPRARSGGRDRVLIGENEGNFLERESNGNASSAQDGDKGRLMAIRERGVRPSERTRSRTSGGGGLRVPTNTRPVVVYAHRLRDLRQGEQVVIEGKVVVGVDSRARFSTQLVLSRDRRDTSRGNVANRINPSAISEHNGINCTQGTSPCTSHRVAVFRVTHDIPGDVYVNLVAKSAVPGGGSTRVVVRRNDGWLRSTRYAPNSETRTRTSATPDPEPAPASSACGDGVASCIDDLGVERCEGTTGFMACGDGTDLQRCTCLPGGFDACEPCGP
jgi:hypothetical protein